MTGTKKDKSIVARDTVVPGRVKLSAAAMIYGP